MAAFTKYTKLATPNKITQMLRPHVIRKIIRRRFAFTYNSKLWTKEELICNVQKLTREQNEVNTTVKGWIQSIRKHKTVMFVNLVDGSTPQSMQVVLNPTHEMASQLKYGAAIETTGLVVHKPNRKPDVEMECSTVKILSDCDPKEYPLNFKDNITAGEMRNFLHLRLRQKTFQNLLRVRNQVEMSIHEYFQSNNFLHIHTPILSSNNCEGGSDLFTINGPTDEQDAVDSNYFQSKVYLTVSAQLHLEACASAIRNVYTISPAFRAEKSISKSHLSEFYMVEAEMCFIENSECLMDVIEDNVKAVLCDVRKNCIEEYNYFQTLISKSEKYRKMVEIAVSAPYKRVTYAEAIKILQKYSDKLENRPANYGEDLNSEQEQMLTKHFKNHPVFIHDYPMEMKPFYVKEIEDGISATVDLVFPVVGELCGGSVREDSYEVLKRRLESLGQFEQYSWYCDLRRFGGVPHAGYGLGFDRLVKFALGINHIKDVVPFPRTFHHCKL